MKKLFALLLAAMLIFVLLTACDENKSSGGSSDSQATETATDKETATPTHADTEAQTEDVVIEVATEAPTEAETEKPQALNNEFVYTDPAGVYQITVPDIWNDTGKIIEGESEGNETVSFVYKTAYNQGAGHVFTIILVDNPANIVDVTQWPHAEELFNDGNMQIFVNYPTDVQFSPYDQPGSAEFNKQQAEYGALKATTEEILDSFIFRDL